VPEVLRCFGIAARKMVRTGEGGCGLRRILKLVQRNEVVSTKFGSGDRSLVSTGHLPDLEENIEWNQRRKSFALSFQNGSRSRIRTCDQSINSRLLYR
jgi:hypothetical protein